MRAKGNADATFFAPPSVYLNLVHLTATILYYDLVWAYKFGWRKKVYELLLSSLMIPILLFSAHLLK
jgi:hypothetical protein